MYVTAYFSYVGTIMEMLSRLLSQFLSSTSFSYSEEYALWNTAAV